MNTSEGQDSEEAAQSATQQEAGDVRAKHSIRLPFFIKDDEVGLGTVVRTITYAVGIQPCSGCERRAAVLNRWLSFRK